MDNAIQRKEQRNEHLVVVVIGDTWPSCGDLCGVIRGGLVGWGEDWSTRNSRGENGSARNSGIEDRRALNKASDGASGGRKWSIRQLCVAQALEAVINSTDPPYAAV